MWCIGRDFWEAMGKPSPRTSPFLPQPGAGASSLGAQVLHLPPAAAGRRRWLEGSPGEGPRPRCAGGPFMIAPAGALLAPTGLMYPAQTLQSWEMPANVTRGGWTRSISPPQPSRARETLKREPHAVGANRCAGSYAAFAHQARRAPGGTQGVRPVLPRACAVLCNRIALVFSAATKKQWKPRAGIFQRGQLASEEAEDCLCINSGHWGNDGDTLGFPPAPWKCWQPVAVSGARVKVGGRWGCSRGAGGRLRRARGGEFGGLWPSAVSTGTTYV